MSGSPECATKRCQISCLQRFKECGEAALASAVVNGKERSRGSVFGVQFFFMQVIPNKGVKLLHGPWLEVLNFPNYSPQKTWGFSTKRTVF